MRLRSAVLLGAIAVFAAAPVAAQSFLGWGITAALAVPTLVPGAGWGGATATPAAQGNSGDPGYSAAAIAAWDAVQFQSVETNTPITVCVAAFHIYGIAKVQFAVAGGAFVDATAASSPASGGLSEYCASVDPSLFAADGSVEVRAIAYPTTGVPLVLQGGAATGTSTALKSSSSLFLYVAQHNTVPVVTQYVSTSGTDISNCNTSGAPCKTITKAKANIHTLQSSDSGGGTICIITDGDYDYGAASEFTSSAAAYRFLTIKTCNGATQAGVRLITGHSIQTEKVHLQNLTVYGTAISTSGNGLISSIQSYLWADNVVADGVIPVGTGAINNPFELHWAQFTTDSRITNYTNGPYSGFGNLLIRNVLVDTVAADAFQDGQAVINSTGTNIGWRVSTAFTATGTSGAVLTVADASSAINGTTALGTNITGTCSGSATTVLSHTSTTITLSQSTTGAVGAFTLDSCAHPDAWQTIATGVSNHVFYGNTLTTGIRGQGVFPSAGSLSSFAIVNNRTDTTLYPNFSAMQVGAQTNFLFQGNTWVGAFALTGGSYTNFVIRNDTCSPAVNSSKTGLTRINSNC